jgi:leader peptidase (prepilin peptidase)/N-methyltransferase
VTDPWLVSLIALLAGLLGLAVGSFLNVVIWRVPRGESVVSPASACPACGHPIRARDNVPLLSWLLLRARCRDCGAPISRRYPLVEAGTALAFASLTALWLTSEPARAAALPALLYLVAISIALAAIDLDTHTLPNRIVLPSLVVGAVLLAAASAATGEWAALGAAAIGAFALAAFYLLLAVIYPAGMGFGDVKLAGVLGLYLGWAGWSALLVGAFAAFILGGLYSIALLALRRATRRSGIPFGPWMLAGAWLGIIAGEPIAHAYLVLVGLE